MFERRTALAPDALWSEVELRAAMPALADDVTDAELRRLARWAGPEKAALDLAGRGAAMLGTSRWFAAYETEPEVWISAIGGAATMCRWRRSLDSLSDEACRLLRCLVRSTTGLDLSTTVACWGLASSCTAALAVLGASGWVTGRGQRMEVPAMRRLLLRAWLEGRPDTTAAVHRFVLRYTARRLARRADWNGDDRAFLADSMQEPKVRMELGDAEIGCAAEALRHGPHAHIAIGFLRDRLTALDADGRRQPLPLRQRLGAALIDMGAYREGIAILRDRSRASRVMRANALIEVGELERGRRTLRGLGPRDGDANWSLQWALCAAYDGDGSADALLQEQLEVATRTRHLGLIWAVYAEAADRRVDDACLVRYPRAIAHLKAAGDSVAAAHCQARLARALARAGRMDDAAPAATEAWEQAQGIAAVSVRGLAALACLEAGLATHEMLLSTLRAASWAESPDLARDAAAALGPMPGAPILGIGPSHARIDGRPITLAEDGPPWRILTMLCRLPAGSTASLDEIFEMGWPGERVRAESRKRRVHTAIWTLRRAGLRHALQTVGRSSYRLQARIIIDRSADDAGE